jgi:hypothetical protein
MHSIQRAQAIWPSLDPMLSICGSRGTALASPLIQRSNSCPDHVDMFGHTSDPAVVTRRFLKVHHTKASDFAAGCLSRYAHMGWITNSSLLPMFGLEVGWLNFTTTAVQDVFHRSRTCYKEHVPAYSFMGRCRDEAPAICGKERRCATACQPPFSQY